MSRIHRRSTKADLRLETLEGRITLNGAMDSPAKLLVVTVGSDLTQSGIPKGQIQTLKHFEKIQNVTKAEKFLLNHPKFGAWYTLNVLNRTQPTGTSPTGQTGTQPGTLPGHILPGPDNQPIAIVFGAGSNGSGSTTSTSDSAGSTGTTTENPGDSGGTLPGHTLTDSSGHPIAIVFGAGSNGSANATSTGGLTGSTTGGTIAPSRREDGPVGLQERSDGQDPSGHRFALP